MLTPTVSVGVTPPNKIVVSPKQIRSSKAIVSAKLGIWETRTLQRNLSICGKSSVNVKSIKYPALAGGENHIESLFGYVAPSVISHKKSIVELTF